VNLHEYQAKQLFARYGIPVLNGGVATSPQEAYSIAKELGGKVVVKAQVLTSGRGRSGGIRLVHSAEEARLSAEHMLGMSIAGLVIHKVIIEPIADITQELYLSVVNDRSARLPVIMASATGGTLLHKVPEKVIREHLDPDLGLHDFQVRQLANGIHLPRHLWAAFTRIAHALSRCFFENDCTLAEINPLALMGDGQLVALDGSITVDDNALFRQPELFERRDWLAEHPLEIRAREAGLSYIRLDGDIGCMVNGAGLAMTSMDIIKHVAARFGFEHCGAANFLDLGGGARADQVAAGLRVILADPKVKAVLVNIFGGITRGDEVARGLLSVAMLSNQQIPIICRLVGTNAEAGRNLILDAKLPHVSLATTLIEATERAVLAAGGLTHGDSR